MPLSGARLRAATSLPRSCTCAAIRLSSARAVARARGPDRAWPDVLCAPPKRGTPRALGSAHVETANALGRLVARLDLLYAGARRPPAAEVDERRHVVL